MYRNLKSQPSAGPVREQPDYMSYLLRLWRMPGDDAGDPHDGGGSVWRASLDSSHTGERVGFASLEDLFGFLQTQAGTAPAGDQIEM